MIKKEESKVLVVGGASIDIIGFPHQELLKKDSNPGTIKYDFGGVGRNIAENLSLLEVKTYLLTALGQDRFGDDLINYCQKRKIETNYIQRYPGKSSSYLAILNSKGDLELAISEMHILDYLEVNQIKQALRDFKTQDILVLDTNLKIEIIEELCRASQMSIFLDPISINKVIKVQTVLAYLYFFKPNRYEAEKLSCISLEQESNYKLALQYFIKEGVQEIVISLGDSGVLLASKDHYYLLKHDQVPLVNATGAGDSFFAGYLKAHILGKCLLEKAKTGILCSIINLNSEQSVSKELSLSTIELMEQKVRIEVVEL